MSALLPTMSAAGRHVGVDHGVIRHWIKIGLLPAVEGGWRPEDVEAAHQRWTPIVRRPVVECGTVAGWRVAACRDEDGRRCAACRAAHNNASRELRREHRAEYWAERVDAPCELLADGGTYTDVLEQLEITAQAVTGQRSVDPVFAARIDAALMQGRDPSLPHGSALAWKAKCRCPECREHHSRSR
ncbi:helix-turn-helix domain-containing protein [Gordonia sihwensis]|uniref:helix-turn-helix domain-containing protein n=1 Tax=Gordonia sihwensis TaxID=173559 RepID=UPI000AB17229|nr:helix-turn-helix domain-containing protein [Gordonia sihwensis]